MVDILCVFSVFCVLLFASCCALLRVVMWDFGFVGRMLFMLLTLFACKFLVDPK